MLHQGKTALSAVALVDLGVRLLGSRQHSLSCSPAQSFDPSLLQPSNPSPPPTTLTVQARYEKEKAAYEGGAPAAKKAAPKKSKKASCCARAGLDVS